MSDFSVPGRGAWTTRGGLLRLKPGSTNSAGYYRMATAGETPVGSDFATGRDLGHDAEVVNLGVLAIQKLAGLAGSDVDGWYGGLTDQHVRAYQQSLGLKVDGIVGQATMRAALSPMVENVAARYGVPAGLLGGLCTNESSLDPAAVGTNGFDHGIAQINLKAHPNVSVKNAMDPHFSLLFAALDMQQTHDRWSHRTLADPWDIAIANHNSPLLASQWASTGVAPIVPGRIFQISEYVERVHHAW